MPLLDSFCDMTLALMSRHYASISTIELILGAKQYGTLQQAKRLSRALCSLLPSCYSLDCVGCLRAKAPKKTAATGQGLPDCLHIVNSWPSSLSQALVRA